MSIDSLSIDRAFHTTAAGTLLAGLAWRPSAGGKPTRSSLVSAAALTESSHHVTLQTSDGALHGLWRFHTTEEGQRLPRSALSAAALFALAVGRSHPTAALALRLPAIAGQEARLYVAVLEAGLPTIDTLGPADDMKRLLDGEAGPVWSNDAAAFPDATMVDADWLVQQGAAAVRASRLHRVPLNPWPALGAAAMVAVLVVAYAGWKRHQATAAQSALEQAVAEADPRPRYLATLAMQRATMSTDRQQMLDVVRHLYRLPVYVPGWQLRGVECTAARQACAASWVRRGGGFDDLRAALPQQRVVLDADAVQNLDIAITTWPITVARGPVGMALPRMDAAALLGGSQWQGWRTAEINVDVRPAVLWPPVAEMPAQFDDPQAVQRGEITAAGVPGALVVDALEAAPPWVSWEAVRLELGEISGPASRAQLQFTLTGHYYVSTASL
jgi:hypothetical protein